jgi:hypothetical protein
MDLAGTRSSGHSAPGKKCSDVSRRFGKSFSLNYRVDIYNTSKKIIPVASG